MNRISGANDLKPDESGKAYTLDCEIDDINLYKSVMYACKLIDEDKKTIDEAVNISGKRYKRDITDIRLNIPRDICENAPAKNDPDYRLYVDITLDKKFKLIAVILSDHNMCCCDSKAPYLLTMLRHKDGAEVYSCQCSCGGWCTNGHDDPADAVKEYESMCERYIKKHRNKA